ncbi:MAG TPA: septum site-determining protein MinC, partial [Arenibaculum sp.]|nr:septum site-determining protein MinC [Arenibaculum sp.]
MMVLKVVAPDDPSFFPQLLHKIRQAPNFFRNAPVVLDLDDLAPVSDGFDFVDFVVQLRSYNLIAVGVQGGSSELQTLAVESGLPVMPSGRP